MVKKKRVKKAIRVKAKPKKVQKGFDVKRKIRIVINNFLLFVALSLVSFVLYRFIPKLIQNQFLQDLFSVMAMVFGFVAAGFLIVLIILFIMKLASKK
jgi:hypothetical protein